MEGHSSPPRPFFSMRSPPHARTFVDESLLSDITNSPLTRRSRGESAGHAAAAAADSCVAAAALTPLRSSPRRKLAPPSGEQENDDDCMVLPTPPRARVIASSAPSASARSPAEAAAASMWQRQLHQQQAVSQDDSQTRRTSVEGMSSSRCSSSTPSHSAAAASSPAAPAATSSSAASSAAAASVSDSASAAAVAPAPLKPTARFNALVRRAKAHEEAGELHEALDCYVEMQPIKPDLESVGKKIRKLRKRIAAMEAEAAMEEGEGDDGKQENAADASPSAASAAAASSHGAAARTLSTVLNGKFAFDADAQTYTLLRSIGDADEQDDGSHGAEADLSDAISTGSKRLSPFRIPSPLYEHIYPYQAEGLHWLYEALHPPALQAARAAAAASGDARFRQELSTGAILGDDMGLGKTVQIGAFLAGLFFSRLARRVLIVSPLSVLSHWEAELAKWCGARSDEEELKGRGAAAALSASVKSSSNSRAGLRLLTVYAGKRTPKQRAAAEAALTALITSPGSGGIVLTSYGQLQSKPELFASFTHPGVSAWDYAILDEGHKIKNPDTLLSQKLRLLPVHHRLLLTGTPVMNDLDELWSLMDWAAGRSLLGTRSDFKTHFTTPILCGLAKGASEAEQRVGAALTKKLKEIIKPHLLRREKAQVKDQMSRVAEKSAADAAAAAVRADESPRAPSAALSSSLSLIPRSLSAPAASMKSHVMPQLTAQKNDWIIWMALTPLQDKLYRAFLGGDSVRSVLAATRARSPLPILSTLKKLCDHPRMIDESMEYCEALRDDLGALEPLPGMQDTPLPAPRARKDGSVSAAASSRAKPMPVASAHTLSEEGRPELERAVRLLCAESLKFACLEQLLLSHAREGHRTLIFSQSLRMLAFVTLLLAHLRLSFLRIDGGVTDPSERQRRVDRFNADASIPVFLLTTRAGGVGLTLTGADRVVILDPDWTPALDNQAVDRAYRLGQKRNVVVYRFITSGTVEEVIYRKQVFKGSVIRAATGVAPARSHGDSASAQAAGADDAAPSDAQPVQARYFNREELREVFHYTSSLSSRTFTSLRALHPPTQRRSYPELDRHATEVEALEGVLGITDHDLLFSETAPVPVAVDEAKDEQQRQEDEFDECKDDPALVADSAEEYREALEERVEEVVARATERTLSAPPHTPAVPKHPASRQPRQPNSFQSREVIDVEAEEATESEHEDDADSRASEEQDQDLSSPHHDMSMSAAHDAPADKLNMHDRDLSPSPAASHVPGGLPVSNDVSIVAEPPAANVDAEFDGDNANADASLSGEDALLQQPVEDATLSELVDAMDSLPALVASDVDSFNDNEEAKEAEHAADVHLPMPAEDQYSECADKAVAPSSPPESADELRLRRASAAVLLEVSSDDDAGEDDAACSFHSAHEWDAHSADSAANPPAEHDEQMNGDGDGSQHEAASPSAEWHEVSVREVEEAELEAHGGGDSHAHPSTPACSEAAHEVSSSLVLELERYVTEALSVPTDEPLEPALQQLIWQLAQRVGLDQRLPVS